MGLREKEVDSLKNEVKRTQKSNDEMRKLIDEMEKEMKRLKKVNNTSLMSDAIGISYANQNFGDIQTSNNSKVYNSSING